jgi:hypothetical protein
LEKEPKKKKKKKKETEKRVVLLNFCAIPAKLHTPSETEISGLFGGVE